MVNIDMYYNSRKIIEFHKKNCFISCYTIGVIIIESGGDFMYFIIVP